MYENITYEQLKALSDEEKKEALLELEKIFPDRKNLAEYLGVKGNVVGILFSRYVEGNKLGRQKRKDDDAKVEDINTQEVIDLTNKKEEQSSIFKIALNGNMIGEEAKLVIAGISNTLLDNRTYSINVTIEEMPTM